MHSSGVHIARSLSSGSGSLSGGRGLCWAGISVQGGLCPAGSLSRGSLSGGGSLSRGLSVQGVSIQGGLCPGESVSRETPRGQTGACENITLPQTSFAGGNKATVLKVYEQKVKFKREYSATFKHFQKIKKPDSELKSWFVHFTGITF